MMYYIVRLYKQFSDHDVYRFTTEEKRDAFVKQLPPFYHENNFFSLDTQHVDDKEKDDFVCPLCGQKACDS